MTSFFGNILNPLFLKRNLLILMILKAGLQQHTGQFPIKFYEMLEGRKLKHIFLKLNKSTNKKLNVQARLSSFIQVLELYHLIF